MAIATQPETRSHINGKTKLRKDGPKEFVSYDINLPYKAPSESQQQHSKRRTDYPDYLPNFDNVWHGELEEFEFSDPALRAHGRKPNVLHEGVSMRDVTPKMGTILTGVKLEKLSDAAKDELALLISERKIVVLRDQRPFLQTGPQFQQDFMRHFGKPNYQPVTGCVKNFPGFHIIHRDGNQAEIETFFKHKTTSTLWHQDVSYEIQPPGYIMLGILACPDVGGDTVFADTAEAYNRLSPTFQQMIDGLYAVHTSEKMIGFAKANGGLVRKPPVTTLHPIVRVHPVTGEKALFLNAEFVQGIEGLKEAESELLVRYLMDHMIKGHDFQARVQWEKDSVVMFDGRNTLRESSLSLLSAVLGVLNRSTNTYHDCLNMTLQG